MAGGAEGNVDVEEKRKYDSLIQKGDSRNGDRDMDGRICGEKQRTCTELDEVGMEEMRKWTLFLTIGDATYTQRKNVPTVITVLNQKRS